MSKIADIMLTLEYGPSPENDDAVRGWLAAQAAVSAISSRAASPSPANCSTSSTPRTARRSPASAQGGPADVDAAVAAARKALPAWSALPGDERARHLYALARHVQKRERFLGVLETMDNGKPIRETRDIDVPLVARHFYHHAGWASLVDERDSRAGAGRRLRPDHSVEFPAADAGVEDRAGVGGGQYGGAEAGRIHAADGAGLRRNLRRGGPAAGRRQHRHRRRRDGRWRSSGIPTSTRSPSPARPKSAASSAARPPARARNCRSNSAASRRSSSSTTPISTAPSRASSTRSGSIRARSAAPARGCWSPRASSGSSSPSCARACRC